MAKQASSVMTLEGFSFQKIVQIVQTMEHVATWLRPWIARFGRFGRFS
jgi:hypothetical protein